MRNLLMFKLQIGPFCDLAISKLLCKLCRMILAQPAPHLLELRPINARWGKLTKMLLKPIGFRSQGGERHAAGNDAAQHRNSFGNTFPHSVFGDLDANNPKRTMRFW